MSITQLQQWQLLSRHIHSYFWLYPSPNQLYFEANPYHIICKYFSLYLKKIRIPLKCIILSLSYLKINNNSSTNPSVVKFHPVPHIFFILAGFSLLSVCLFEAGSNQPGFTYFYCFMCHNSLLIYILPVPLSSILCFLCWRNWLFVNVFLFPLDFWYTATGPGSWQRKSQSYNSWAWGPYYEHASAWPQSRHAQLGSFKGYSEGRMLSPFYPASPHPSYSSPREISLEPSTLLNTVWNSLLSKDSFWCLVLSSSLVDGSSDIESEGLSK